MVNGKWLFRLLLLCSMLTLTAGGLRAYDEQAETEAEAEEADEVVELEGVFEGTHHTAYSLQPKEWSDFVILEAVPHGTSVRAGQVLLRFETESLDDKLAELARQRQVDDLGLRQAEEELAIQQKSMPLDLAKAKQDEQIANEDLANFVKIDRPQRVKDLEFSVEQSENYLSYEREELDQLEKMYKADDLTEETEEIILTRSRNAVKAAEYSLHRSRLSQQQGLDIELPRQEQELKKALRDAALAAEKLGVMQPIELNQARLDLEQKKADFQQQAKTIEHLQSDRELLTIKSRQDGYVYYGDTVAGTWPEIAQLRKTLQPGNTAPTNQTLLHVVAARPMFVRASVPEEHLHELKKGLQVKVTPTGYPDIELEGRVAEISPIPVADGEFEAIVEVKFAAGDAKVVPGMSVKVALPSDEK